MTNLVAPTHPHGWLIVKRDLYYRPDARGYTGIRDHAGRYSWEEAANHVGHGCTIVHESVAPEFRKAAHLDIVIDILLKQRTEARSERDAAQARVKELDEHNQRLGMGNAERYWEGRFRDEAGWNANRERDAGRYRWLRERSLDTIERGGVFGGRTGINGTGGMVLNQHDLDNAIDAAMMAEERAKSPPCGECHLPSDETCDICGRKWPEPIGATA
jgi:hypothetical protein